MTGQPLDPNAEAHVAGLLEQSDLESAIRILRQNLDWITAPFLQSLDHAGNQALSEDDLSAAKFTYRIAIEAARLVEDFPLLTYFLNQLGITFRQAGQIEQTTQAFQEALEWAERCLQDGYENAEQAYLSIVAALADLEVTRQNYDAARQYLGDARRYFHSVASPAGQLWVIINLVSVAINQADVESCQRYATLIAPLFEEAGQEKFDPVPLPDVSACVGAIIEVGRMLYYDYEDFPTAKNLFADALKLVPEEMSALIFLGYCQIQLEEYAQAAQTWDRIVAQEPTVQNYHNYAGVLTNLERFEAAYSAASEAIKLDPHNPKSLFLRAQICQRLGQYEQAIADSTQVLHLISSLESAAPEPHPKPKSKVEYERYLPLQDLADFARMIRIDSYRSLGRMPEAQKDVDWFLEHGDAVMKAWAHSFIGDLSVEGQRYVDAIASYTSALQIEPENLDYHLKRAGACIAQGLYADAISDLAFLARQDRDPHAAIDLLTEILDRKPDFALARKWRGYAYWAAWNPSKAEADLTAALDLLPEDGTIYYWRGLARITFDPSEQGQVWNESFSGLRVRDSIADLGKAVVLERDHQEALAAYKWLVQRTFLDDLLEKWLVFGFPPENYLFEIFPNVEPLMQRFIRAQSLMSNFLWQEALEELLDAQTGLAELDLHILSRRLYLDISQCYLRNNDLQDALDSIKRFQELYLFIGQPLTPHLKTELDERQRISAQLGVDTVGVEIDYLPVYGLGQDHIGLRQDALEAEILARIGDRQQALAVLAESEDLVSAAIQVCEIPLRKEWAIEVLISLLRSMLILEQYENGLALSERILRYATLDTQAHAINLLVGKIHARLGENRMARRHLQRVRTWASKTPHFFYEFYIPSTLELVNIHLYSGQPGKAFDVLNPIYRNENNIQWSSPEQHFDYLILSADVLYLHGQFEKAQVAILDALDVVETIRSELMHFDARRAWRARQDEVYRTAVQIAQAANDDTTALNVVEKAKGRTFLDQLVSAGLPLPDTSLGDAAIEQNLLEERELLMQLLDSLKKSFLDYELLSKLSEMGVDFASPDQEMGDSAVDLLPKVLEELSKVEDRLTTIRNEREENRLRSAQEMAGAVLTLPEIQNSLQLD